MKKIICFSTILFVICSTLISQQSFELTVSTDENEMFNFSFMDFENNYISIGGASGNFSSDSTNGFVVKYDNFGNIINQKEVIKLDTTFGFKYGLVKGNGNYILLGTFSDSISPSDRNVTYLCEMTPQLDIVWEKVYEIPEPYINHLLINFLIDSDSNIIIQGRVDSSMYSTDDLLFTSMYDMEGNQLAYNLYENWTDYGAYNEFIFNYDSTGFYLIGQIGINYVTRDWVEFDNNLNIIGSGDIENWVSLLSSPVSAQWLSNGNMIIANRTNGISFPTYQDLEVRIVDQEFNMLKDTIIYYDEYVYLPVNKGLGFIDENNIWIATFQGSPTFLLGTAVFNIHVFDSNLNLKGVKEFGGDTRYWFYDLTVTSDGGCLLTGIIPDYEGSFNSDAYVIKVMPDDIITHAEETPFDFDTGVFVFPNPFSTEINIQTEQKGLTFNLYDATGRCYLNSGILSNSNNILSSGNIKPGFYFYTIQYQNRIIQSGKLIKE